MKLVVLLGISFIFISCSNNAAPTIISNTNNTANQPMRSEKLDSTISHTTENQTPRPVDAITPTGGKWSQSGDAIETAKYDGKIAEAEKAVKAKPTDEALNKTLAEAYFDRGFALTEARQYASALGDYRRTLKHDPNNPDAKKWIDQIITIYAMLKKEYPKEGEEPPPLPYKK